MQKSAGDAKAIFRMQGMNIPGQAKKLRLELGKLVGIGAVNINYVTDTVSIRYDGKELTLDSIRNAIFGRRSVKPLDDRRRGNGNGGNSVSF